MKSFLTKLVAMFLAAMMILTSAGCGKKNAETAADDDGYTYLTESSKIIFPANTYMYGSIRREGDSIEYLTVTEKENEDSVFNIVKSNVDGSSEQKLELENTNIGYPIVTEWFELKDGGYELACVEYDDLTGDMSYYLLNYDPAGKLIGKYSLDELLEENEEMGLFDFSINSDGDLVGGGNEKIYVLSLKGELKRVIKSGGMVEKMAMDSNGKMYAFGYFGLNDECLKEIDFAAGKLGKELKNIPEDVLRFMFEDDGNIIFTTYASLYEYNMETEKTEKILDWIDADMKPVFNAAISREGDTVTIIGESDASELFAIEKTTIKKVSDTGERKNIIIAAADEDMELIEAIRKFNKSQSEYRAKIVAYNVLYKKNGFEKFKADFEAGKVDVVMFTDAENGWGRFDDSYFVDLKPFLDSDDEVSVADLNANAFSNLCTDDKLYKISPFFNIKTIMANTKYVDKDNWSLDEVYELQKKEWFSIFCRISFKG